MSRLTSYKNGLEREMICRYEDCDTVEEYCPHLNEANCPCLQEMLNKLAEYEDLEEQGLLVKLPCKNKPKTNADRIRNMTDDELASFLIAMQVSTKVRNKVDSKKEMDEYLQAEVKEGAE